ncbi:MAG: hypothetical protein KJN76_02475 [Eudoraea sp.]|nr:hypothetical protein [Eudoraea sp.]
MKMDIPYLAEALFILSLLIFLMALIMIVPTILAERRLDQKKRRQSKTRSYCLYRRKRKFLKALKALFTTRSKKTFFINIKPLKTH